MNPETGEVYMEKYKYLNNLIEQPYLLVAILIGVVLVLFGIGKTIFSPTYSKGDLVYGIGTVIVTVLFLMAGWNNTAYYPSTFDLQSSLTIRNSSSEFTLEVMSWALLPSHLYLPISSTLGVR